VPSCHGGRAGDAEEPSHLPCWERRSPAARASPPTRTQRRPAQLPWRRRRPLLQPPPQPPPAAAGRRPGQLCGGGAGAAGGSCSSCRAAVARGGLRREGGSRGGCGAASRQPLPQLVAGLCPTGRGGNPHACAQLPRPRVGVLVWIAISSCTVNQDQSTQLLAATVKPVNQFNPFHHCHPFFDVQCTMHPRDACSAQYSSLNAFIQCLNH
jgi:hypothetical protein